MNLIHQLATEAASMGHTVSLDVASRLLEEGYDISNLSVDGFEVIDLDDVDYFDHIDANH